ncbi:hypothetical protein P9743_12685, partial [Anoxybacillus geothermalis]|nr:hypothetical protein [Anoxybacillus geothermalis]
MPDCGGNGINGTGRPVGTPRFALAEPAGVRFERLILFQSSPSSQSPMPPRMLPSPTDRPP